MNRIVQPDKEAEKAFQKMVEECAKEQKEKNLPYVNATRKETEKLFKEMGAKEKLGKKEDGDTLVVY